MVNNNVLSREKISFIESFSKNEWLMNSWEKEKPGDILSFFEKFALFIKDGNYLELGCGTGLLCKFLFLFYGKKIIPFGVDSNLNAIKMAKKNNPEFADNFIEENYFESLKLNALNFSKFSTISIFISFEKYHWEKLRKVIVPIVKECKKTNFLIIAYDSDFFHTKDKETVEFISAMKKISSVSVADHFLLVIGKEDKEIHIISKKLRKSVLEYEKDTKSRFIVKKIIEGIITEKNSSSFFLIKKDFSKNKKIKKLKFFLISNSRFSKMYRTSNEKVINWKDINNGDRAIVIFGRDGKRNIVFGVIDNSLNNLGYNMK